MARGKYQEWLQPDQLLLLEGWKRDGLSDEQIAHNMGIAYSTLKDWKQKYSAISDALKKGKEVAIYEIENSLFKRARGFQTEEVTEELRKDAKGRIIESHVKRVRKQVPPDTGAAIFILKNARPEKWSDRPKADDADIEDLTDIRKAVFGE